MMFTTDYRNMLIVCAALGIGKGIRSVYMSIVVPSYIPLERLASASAIQLFVNGVVMMCIGPILGSLNRLLLSSSSEWCKLLKKIVNFISQIGLIKDISGSYVGCIVFLNICTIITITMYGIEMAYTWYREKCSSNDTQQSISWFFFFRRC